jgi:hypothetical protein
MTTSPNPPPLVCTDFKQFWDETVQQYGLGARLTLVVSDVHPQQLIAKSNDVDSLDLVPLPEGSALFYIDNACDASGTRCHISMRREGDGGEPEIIADCKDVDTTVLHNYVVQSLLAFGDQRAKPNCYAALLSVNLGKKRSSEPFYMLNVVSSVDTLLKSSSFPARGDFKRPKWAPDFDGAMMRRLLAETAASQPKAKPCKSCGDAAAAASAAPSTTASGMSTKTQIAIIVGALVGALALAILGVAIYEMVRRRRLTA